MTWWQVLGAVMGAVAAFIAAVSGVMATRSKVKVERGTVEIDSVKISLESLQAALTRSDAERVQLRTDLTAEETLSASLQHQINELHTKIAEMERRHAAHIAVLRNEIRRLGGDPDRVLESM